jgi:hypothetical protein
MKDVPALTTKILDKLANAGNKRVAFGDKAYAQSERIILLAGNFSIVGVEISGPVPAPTQVTPPPAQTSQSPNSSPSPTTSPLPLPPGYILSKEDLLEIFPLVSRNTPVIIH